MYFCLYVSRNGMYLFCPLRQWWGNSPSIYLHFTLINYLIVYIVGTLEAHGHNESGSCWRKYPSGAVSGDENCLTLDIFTSSVIYSDLKPVVVYVDGDDDLSPDEAEALQPSAKLAQSQNTVFVSVNYRSGILGFLSLKSLSSRSATKSSGNYGLGDIISALKWVKTNIQHFGKFTIM